jgi:WhiB family redox-sensing transcriptional regulator
MQEVLADVKMLPATGEWSRRALCIGMDPNIWQPRVQDEAGCAEAKAVCGRCPVQEECLEYALAYYPAGVWGGTSEADRRRIRAKRRRGAVQTASNGSPARCPGCRSQSGPVPAGGGRSRCLDCGATWAS